MAASQSLDPSKKTIIDNAVTSLLDFAYLMVCRPSVLIYRSGQKICRSLLPSPFC